MMYVWKFYMMVRCCTGGSKTKYVNLNKHLKFRLGYLPIKHVIQGPNGFSEFI